MALFWEFSALQIEIELTVVFLGLVLWIGLLICLTNTSQVYSHIEYRMLYVIHSRFQRIIRRAWPMGGRHQSKNFLGRKLRNLLIYTLNFVLKCLPHDFLFD
jgi:hypothetical protein